MSFRLLLISDLDDTLLGDQAALRRLRRLVGHLHRANDCGILLRLAKLGSMSLGGNIIPVQNLAESLQVAFGAGAKRILLPMASVSDIPTIPGELFAKFQTSFYSDPSDAAFKALGVE